VNSVAVPVYFSRGLYITALLYVVFWVNAIVALVHWRRLLQARDA
jgi:nicotinamide mononucleotide transporter